MSIFFASISLIKAAQNTFVQKSCLQNVDEISASPKALFARKFNERNPHEIKISNFLQNKPKCIFNLLDDNI